MRNREPFGRGVAAIAAPSCVPRRRSQQHDVAGRRRLQTGRRGELVGAGARDRGERSERRQAEQLAAAQLDLRCPRRVGEAARPAAPRGAAGTSAPAAVRHRVAAADQPGGAGQQRHRLLAGPVPRGQQLGIEVEERDDVGVLRAVQHGLGADQHVAVGQRLAVAGDHARPAGRRPPRSPRAAG